MTTFAHLLYRSDTTAQCVQVFCEGHLQPTAWMPSVNHSLLASVIIHLEHLADAKCITKHGLLFPHETSPTSQSMTALSVSTRVPSPSWASCNREDTTLAHYRTSNWLSDRKRQLCVLCFKSFRLMRHHCRRMCGEVMCADWVATLPLVAPPAFDDSSDANFPLTNHPAVKQDAGR